MKTKNKGTPLYEILSKKPGWSRNKKLFAIILVGVVSGTGAVFGLLAGLFSFWPEWFQPFTLWSFWETKGNPAIWMAASWPFFLWAFIFALVRKGIGVSTIDVRQMSQKGRTTFLTVTSSISLFASPLEEIVHRWVLFLLLMPLLLLLNFLSGGALEWFHLNGLGPFSDGSSLGYLKTWIFHPVWVVGAALVVSNILFAAQHLYQGRFGVANSWFLGLWFFWLLFEYGLVACILLHVTYNLFLFGITYFLNYKEFHKPEPTYEVLWPGVREAAQAAIQAQKVGVIAAVDSPPSSIIKTKDNSMAYHFQGHEQSGDKEL